MKDSKPIQEISFLLIKNLFPLRFCPVTGLGSNSSYYPFKVKVLHYSPIFKSLNTSIPYYNIDRKPYRNKDRTRHCGNNKPQCSSWFCLSLCLSFLLTGDSLSLIPQQGQNEPSCKKWTSHLLQYFLPKPYLLSPTTILESNLSHKLRHTMMNLREWFDC